MAWVDDIIAHMRRPGEAVALADGTAFPNSFLGGTAQVKCGNFAAMKAGHQALAPANAQYMWQNFAGTQFWSWHGAGQGHTATNVRSEARRAGCLVMNPDYTWTWAWRDQPLAGKRQVQGKYAFEDTEQLPGGIVGCRVEGNIMCEAWPGDADETTDMDDQGLINKPLFQAARAILGVVQVRKALINPLAGEGGVSKILHQLGADHVAWPQIRFPDGKIARYIRPDGSYSDVFGDGYPLCVYDAMFSPWVEIPGFDWVWVPVIGVANVWGYRSDYWPPFGPYSPKWPYNLDPYLITESLLRQYPPPHPEDYGSGTGSGLTPSPTPSPTPAPAPSPAPGVIETRYVTPDAPVDVPGSFSGVHYPLTLEGSTTPIPAPTYRYALGRALQANANGKAECLFWRNVETSPGVYDWTDADAYMAGQSKPIVVPVVGPPTWRAKYPNEASPWPSWPGAASPPADSEHGAMRSFYRTMFNRYPGKIRAFEMGNEPRFPHTSSATNYVDRYDPATWAAHYPSKPAPFFSGSPTDLANMAASMRNEFAGEVDIFGAAFVDTWGTDTSVERFMNAPVTIPGLGGTGKSHIDAFSFHYYMTDGNPFGILQVIDGYRAKLTALGLGAMPMWDTETGAEAPGGFTASDPTAPDAIRTWAMLAAIRGVKSIIFYAHTNHPDAVGYLSDPTTNADVQAALDFAFQLGGEVITDAAKLTDGRVWIKTQSGREFLSSSEVTEQPSGTLRAGPNFTVTDGKWVVRPQAGNRYTDGTAPTDVVDSVIYSLVVSPKVYNFSEIGEIQTVLWQMTGDNGGFDSSVTYELTGAAVEPAYPDAPESWGNEIRAVAKGTARLVVRSVADPTKWDYADLLVMQEVGIEPPEILPVSSGAGPRSVRGRGVAGATVRLYVDGAFTGTATVSANGDWAMSITGAVGAYALTADQVKDGAISALSAVRMVVIHADPPVGVGGGHRPSNLPGRQNPPAEWPEWPKDEKPFEIVPPFRTPAAWPGEGGSNE